MQCLFLDFETYFSNDYTLRQMTPVEYIMDPRFEALGCAFVDERGNPVWVNGPDLASFMAGIDWENTLAISHNALFDMLVLAYRYGIHPKMYGCTLSMARNHLAHKISSLSLASVSQHYGLPNKMETLSKSKGVSFTALQWQPDLYEEMKRYGVDDAQKCRTIFYTILHEGFPPEELHTVDWVIRMAAQPKFELDPLVLAEHLAATKAAKAQLLAQASLVLSDELMSDIKFATLLEQQGVDAPMKISKRTGKEAFAFAKTDKEFTALLDHDNPVVQALVAARLGHKSTIEESRTERLIAISRCAPTLPVPLKYSGAHTHRFSGDWKINLQNLPRGGELRRALRAPSGKVVVAVDASQIEARINASFSGEKVLVDAFAGRLTKITGMEKTTDVYAWFAGFIYRKEILKGSIERFVGKTAILSLGYGSSWQVFQAMCRNQGDVHLSDTDAQSVVHIYRNMFMQIRGNWRRAESILLDMSRKDGGMWGPIKVERWGMLLPDGNRLRYRDLGMDQNEQGKWGWQFMRGPVPQRIYGAKLVENAVQAMAFVHIKETAMRVKKLTKGLLMPSHQVHDELIYIVDEHLADMVKELVVAEMSKPPTWMPDVPLAAEGKIGHTYYDAK